jgi:hypothetical protein
VLLPLLPLPLPLRVACSAGASGQWLDGDWAMELWAVTNFPPGETTKRLMEECKTLPGNCISYVGKPR